MKPGTPLQLSSLPGNYSLEDELLGQQYAELSQKMAKRPLVLFFTRTVFSDSTKYLYLRMLESNCGCDVLLCSFHSDVLASLREHGLPCFDLRSDGSASCNLLLEASAAVFCENLASSLAWNPMLFGCLAGAQKIQLWHGVSVKQLSLMLGPHLSVENPMFRRQLRFTSQADHFLSTSSALDAFWVRAFGCTSLVRAGYPRNEVIVRPPRELEMIGSALPPEQADLLRCGRQKKILLVPTWQRSRKPLYISSPAFHQRIATWAAANDAIVFVKEHPFLSQMRVPANVAGRLYFLPAGFDVYPWMSCFDALITDYSSIMFDFLLTHRPIFTFDTRTQVSWGFEPDYSLIPDGQFRYEFDAGNFEDVLNRNLADHPLFSAQQTLSGRLFETPATEACDQLASFVVQCSTVAVEKNFTVTTPKPTPRATAASAAAA